MHTARVPLTCNGLVRIFVAIVKSGPYRAGLLVLIEVLMKRDIRCLTFLVHVQADERPVDKCDPRGDACAWCLGATYHGFSVLGFDA